MMWKYLVPMLLASTPAFADPVSATVALISVGVTAATATVAITWTAAFYQFAAVYALSELSKALAPSAPKASGSETRGYEISGVSPAAPHAVVYGRTKVGGVVVYKETTGGGAFLHMAIAIAGHEIDDVEEVYFDDKKLDFFTESPNEVSGPDEYESVAFVYKHLGADDQIADQLLVQASAGKWTGSHTLSGIAYVYVKLKFNANSFPNGEPSITFVVRGKKVYNPSTQVTEFSSNPALCLRDYLTSDYGLGADADEIDDVSFAAAAAVCDETVSLVAGGTETRYTTNGSIITDVEPQTAIDDLTRSMAGSMWYAQGKFRTKAGAYTSPVLALDENDNLSNIRIQTRASRSIGFNSVTGKYRGEESDWQTTDFNKVVSTEFLQVDNNQETTADIVLPFTTTTTMAQRLAKVMLYRNREQIALSGTFGIRALRLQVGDIVTYSNAHLGFSDKTFEVTGWQFAPAPDGMVSVTLTLSEISAAVYDPYADEALFESNNTILTDAFFVPTVGLTLEQDTRIINEHVISILRAIVSASDDSRIDYVEVEYKLASDTVYNQLGVGELGVFEAIDLVNGVYDVRVRAINTFGNKGSYTTSQFNLAAQIEPPDDVQVFAATVNGSVTTLEWEAIPNLDLSYYKIRHAIETSGAKFADATTSFEKVPRPATSVTVPARAGTYMIQAYDKVGIPSENSTSVVVDSASLNQYTTTNTATEHPAFSGTKTDCTVSANNLRITDVSSSPSTATYTFANDIDTGAVRQVHVTGFVGNNRLIVGAGLWDDLTGNIDTLSGLWDDLTADPQFPDTNVLFYISATDDDPSGSPTWSAYTPFKAGQFSGRAFRFKVELKSESDDVTPNIDELYAKVEY
jgi:hypothetical protein